MGGPGRLRPGRQPRPVIGNRAHAISTHALSFIDLHAHILPGLDDGPKDMAESVAMARAAAADGTSVIVATPHQRDVMLDSSVKKVRELVDELNAALAQDTTAGVAVPRILAGMENHVEPDLPDWVGQGKALTINGTRYILAEPPVTGLPDYVEAVLTRLLAKGLVPVIAHPERNVIFQRDPDRLARWLRAGMLCQVTAGALLGAQGPEAKKAAETFLRRGFVHVIASDMHAAGGTRSPAMRAAFERAEQAVGEGRARDLFEATPAQLLDDCPAEGFRPRAGLTRRSLLSWRPPWR